MASAVPFDPYDDMDNNPFAEPEDHTPRNDADDSILSTHNMEHGEVADSTAAPLMHNDKSTDSQEEDPQKSESIAPAVEDLLPERTNSKYQLFVQVTGIERAGSLTNRKENPSIKFDCNTNLPIFRKQRHKNLKKTYAEFYKLFKYLNAAIPETFVPALPNSSTSYGINNQEDAVKTASNFQVWFNRITSDPIIIRNDELAIFIESDFNTYTPIRKYTSISGLRRKTMKQLSPPYDETLTLAEFRPLVKSIYLSSQDVQARLLKMSTIRRQLSQEINQFGQCFQTLSLDSSGLYHKFGRVITAIGDIDSIIANLDMATLYDPFESIEKDAYIIKEALTNRHFIMRELLQAQQLSKQKQENARRLRAKRDINPLKVDESIRQLKDATRHEHELTIKLRRITANMLIERQRWLSYLDDLIAKSIKEFILRKIEYDRKKLSLLERIRVTVRTADGKGGLSRLGRSLPALSGTTSSQSHSGDSWTGDKSRKPHMPNGVLTTEFDKAVFTESTSVDPARDSNESVSDPLSARQAASLLGDGSF